MSNAISLNLSASGWAHRIIALEEWRTESMKGLTSSAEQDHIAELMREAAVELARLVLTGKGSK